MQAIILAGGKGTRLKPYTVVLPKPLMPIGDYPILEVIIRQLSKHSFNNITMAIGHLKQLLQAFFDDGKKWNVDIKYSVEEKPLGTAAPLSLIEDFEDDFLVLNGDVLTNLNYSDFFQYHKAENAVCTIASYAKPVKIDLGILEVDDSDCLTDYIEKPTLHYDVSMGIYAFRKEVLTYIPKGEYFDFPDLIRKLLSQNKKVMRYRFDGYWLDIGRPEDYERATEEFEKHRDEFLGDLE